jgi:hypothetical protein
LLKQVNGLLVEVHSWLRNHALFATARDPWFSVQ